MENSTTPTTYPLVLDSPTQQPWASHHPSTRQPATGGYFLSQSPSATKPMPRVRKPNLHSDRGQDSNPSDPRARMVKLYHGGP
ncbi:hypothetical protein E2C01_050375 [Portunus trituberculatus]|uniref:Uncharacterized protein n=1 Tax=Portunus trituberculatus TaxID=210409 RepID=A0A5B7GGB4_PORTR|nr:hypothetical protein [Portunus trituberculatus]